MEDKLSREQQNALHLYCEDLADGLNAAGFDQRVVLKPGIEIPWSKESVKELLWKNVQMALIGKSSTADLAPGQVTEVYEALNKGIGVKFGVSAPFPTKEDVAKRKAFKEEQAALWKKQGNL